MLSVVDRIHCPTLIMTGEHDVGSTPAMAKALAARLSAGTVSILPGLRHLALVEAPAEVADRLDELFAV